MPKGRPEAGGAVARLILAACCWLLVAMEGPARAADPPAAGPAIEDKLARVIAHIRETQPATGALAAHVTTSGHWRIADAKSEVMTAAGAEEVKRVVGILSPVGTAKGGQSVPTIVMTADAAAQTAREPQTWPFGAGLSLLAGKRLFPLRIETADGKQRVSAEIAPGLLLEVGSSAHLEEALWQMERPVTPDAVRLLALEPGGPRTLRTVPVREPGSGLTRPDGVDPYGLVKALPALRGQKVLVVGRLDKELLWYQPRSGPEQSILTADLTSAAADNDIALVVIDTRLPRQPGERTWAFLKVDVPGLDQAMQSRTSREFYGALGAAHGPTVMRVIDVTADRVRMEAVPLRTAWGRLAGGSGIGVALQDVVSGLTGNVSPVAARLELPTRSRHEELARRWVPGIPSGVQITYALLLALGLAAWPIATRWWARLWPVERPEEYRSALGLNAARGVRWLVFLAVFSPAVAVVSFPFAVVARIWETVSLLALSLRSRKKVRHSAAEQRR